jgi:uncharacterized protein YegL
MSQLSDFTIAAPRPLPVIVLADVSGSMSEHGKIESLNHALAEMLTAFGSESQEAAQIHVAVITFGGEAAELHTALAPASSVKWNPMRASGRTPLGGAVALATTLVEDRTKIPGRAYRPVIVLASDGAPTDEWQKPIQQLLLSERGKRADRFALAIGDDADKAMLGAFVNDPARPVLAASEARQIQKFFKWVTMSVTARSRSATPNATLPPPTTDFVLDEI